MPAPSISSDDIPQNHLPESAIKPLAFIWYQGRTPLGTWDCPARITKVFKKKRVFRVMSLDDFEKQDQDYEFDVAARSPTSRRTMRPASNAEVLEYLKGIEKRFAEDVREAAARDLSGARGKLNRVRDLMKRLKA